MPWTNARSFHTTEREDTIGIEVEWTDEAEFSADPFRYRDDRVVMTVAGRERYRDAANAAVAAERTRRQQEASRKATILNFMNGA